MSLERLGQSDRFWECLPALAAAMVLAITMTLANTVLRWARWHFLTRRIGIRLQTRDSLLVYMAALPGIVTPFCLGELARAVLVGRKYARHRLGIVLLWPLERATDLFVLAAIGGLVWGSTTLVLIFGAIWLAALVAISIIYRGTGLRQCARPLPCAVLLGTTVAAWLTPAAALWGIFWLWGDPLQPGAALGTLSSGTILGTMTVSPLGTGVTGSSLVAGILDQGINPNAAILGTLALRAGTAWFAVGLGVAVAVSYRHWLLGFWRIQPTTGHFDEIAAEYQAQIPQHVRDRLLTRKVQMMQQRVNGNGHAQRLLALDLGCGQGWYACEMARLGHQVVAVDLSQRQVQQARQYLEQQHVRVAFAAASAAKLPLPDNSCDFAYAINMLHHVQPKQTQQQLLEEVVRVLKPGGVFFLQEINVTNPLFRLYMSYLFPLLRTIDEGTELWIKPKFLPSVPGARWLEEVDYLTFLPDFLPTGLLRPLGGLERVLEQSRLRSWSAHYVARLVKQQAATGELAVRRVLSGAAA
jgi:ubiquinone/menaquinone biosynthesis C-methylase UbiE